MASEMRSNPEREVLERIRRVPPGRVTTYGDLSPRAPRFAGQVLSRCHDPSIPWQRIVRSDGSLAKGEQQRRLLRAEGVPFRGARVDMDVAWVPADDLRSVAGDCRTVAGKADFTEEEWKTILEAPPSAGLVVILSDRGGSVRETFSMAKAYTEARRQHGESELLDEIAAAKPETDRTRAGSPEELKQHSLDNVRQAIALLKDKATDDEVEEYRKFILGLAERVAEARKEGFLGLSGERVSDAERAAIGEIEAALA
jgi:alkylated DNA nucleotide flippase Atl1